MRNHANKRPVTLEDLLKLKRAELPPAEFWSQFDRELRAKQLAALVEQRPWWRTMPRFFAGFSRYQLPLGATAVLALTLVSVHYYRPASAENVSARVANVDVSATAVVNHSAPMAQSSAASQEELGVTTSGLEATSDIVTPPAPVAPREIPALASVDSPADRSEVAREISTPSGRLIAANLAIAKSSDPAIAHGILGSARGFEARAMPARSPAVDPLAQMTSPSDARRSRLLGGSVMSVSMNSAPAARPAEFRSRRISDEQLYDTISRFGARATASW
jgi:hypothetical protein